MAVHGRAAKRNLWWARKACVSHSRNIVHQYVQVSCATVPRVCRAMLKNAYGSPTSLACNLKAAALAAVVALTAVVACVAAAGGALNHAQGDEGWAKAEGCARRCAHCGIVSGSSCRLKFCPALLPAWAFPWPIPTVGFHCTECFIKGPGARNSAYSTRVEGAERETRGRGASTRKPPTGAKAREIAYRVDRYTGACYQDKE